MKRLGEKTMNLWVGDLEGDGLLEDVTVVWCGVFTNGEEVKKFTPTQIPEMMDFLKTVDVLCFHNGTGYDLPVLEKLYGYKHEGVMLDTLVLSRLLQPERVGRHSIEAWGERLGVPKPAHEDWSQFSEEMLHRCEKDVEINWRVLHILLEEAEMSLKELLTLPKY